MVISLSDNIFEKFPICDTNILINFSLIELIDEFIKYRGKIFICDIVKKELIRKIDDCEEYKFIVENIENNDNITVIDKSYFEEERICVMNANLNQYELEENSLLTEKLCPNLGEFISCIYAVNLGINIFITNDMRFINKYKDEDIFSNLYFKNMVQELDSFVGKEKRKEYTKKIKTENDKMEEVFDEKKMLELIDRWQSNLA